MKNVGTAVDPQNYEAILEGRLPKMLFPAEVEPGDVIYNESWLKRIARKDERTDDMTVLWFDEGPWTSLCMIQRNGEKRLYLHKPTGDG